MANFIKNFVKDKHNCTKFYTTNILTTTITTTANSGYVNNTIKCCQNFYKYFIENKFNGKFKTSNYNLNGISKLYLFHILCFMTFIIGAASLPPIIKIGALFTEDQKDSNIELAFKFAVYRINKDKQILPKTQLVYDIEYVPRYDSFRTTKKVCHQMELGIQAIFGPSDPLLGAHIQSICEALDIPHIEARIDLDPISREFSINLYPSQEYMNIAYRDLMNFLNWTKVAIVYEEDFGLLKQQELMRTSLNIEIYMRQATPETYRNVLREIRQKDIYKIIIDTNPDYINSLFRAILQLQMNDYRYHYMLTTFDVEGFDLEDFKYNNVNITAFRLVDVESKQYNDVMEQMNKFLYSGSVEDINTSFQTEAALMFDSVYAFAAGLMDLDISHALVAKNLSCDLEEPWEDGVTLYNYINSAAIDGLTGKVDFNDGKRNNFKIDLLKLRREHIEKVGYWSPTDGINVTDPRAFYDTAATNITLVVMTREETPYVMIREDKKLTGNARYEGFCIDLLQQIARQVGFHYEIRMVPDNMYGVYNIDTKKWNGIVHELMERRADLAVASMTINYARESVIDFTKPFMNLGIGILFKVPTSQPTRLFSFMNPLAVEIWLYVLAAYIMVSFTLFVMARFSPYEWNNPHPCLQESDIVENQFSVSNSFWFITGTFLRQGSGLNPKRTERPPNRLFSFMNPLAIDIWFYIAFAYILVSLTIWVVARVSPIEWKIVERCSGNCEHMKGGKKYSEEEIHLDSVTSHHEHHHLSDESDMEKIIFERSSFKGKMNITENSMYNENFSKIQDEQNLLEYMTLLKASSQTLSKSLECKKVEFEVVDNSLVDSEPENEMTKDLNESENLIKTTSVNEKVPNKMDSDAKIENNRQLVLVQNENKQICLPFRYPIGPAATTILASKGLQREEECFPHTHHDENQHELISYENDFSLRNSFWFTIGTLMQQGSDLNPRATSTRIVGGIWWFFTLIIISSYTANLAAFLTVERMITPIESAADLADQTEIAYGTLKGGSTMTFFRDSKIGIYQKMWQFMNSKKLESVFVETYEDGIKRVLEGNYAFLMESTMLDYNVQRDCNLTQIGGLLDSKGYGIATPKGSPWRDVISLAILELQEKGMIQILYDKWWKNTGDICNRDDKAKESKANALGVENIGGVFVVLLCGLALAVVVAILEFCWNSKKNAQTERQSLCSEMAEELRFAMHCHASKQRPALKRNCTKCTFGTTYVPGNTILNGVQYN